MSEPTMVVLTLLLGCAVSSLSAFLGIGGGIVMAPALLYLPPLLGMDALDMRTVTGLTITQALFACLSGAVGHDRYHGVSRRLVVWMGIPLVLSGLTGAVASGWIANKVLMAIFAVLALTAAALMLVPKKVGESLHASDVPFNRHLAVSIAVVVGLLGGMVGQGGSFILVPLMLYVLKLPIKVVIGSNLGIVSMASLAGFTGKMVTGQIPLMLAIALVMGALPGAQLGAMLSQRAGPAWLKTALSVVIGLCAVIIIADALGQI